MSKCPDNEKMAALSVADFYERSAWPVGTRVQHPADPATLGVIVKRGGRIWVNRETLPWVRWDGSIDAVQVAWDQLMPDGYRGTA